jgi:GT2 family glycosyltransferase
MFVFVILHYKTMDATVECVNSINQNFNNDKVIIIVDNNSPNGSGKDLSELYQDKENIIILRNLHNQGYARGLNTGIAYAKEHYSFDFIILLNNDTEIYGMNWDSTIHDKFNEYKFHVLGPDIIALDNSHGNPMVEKINGVPDLIKIMGTQLIDIVINFLYLKKFTDNMKSFIKKLIRYHKPDLRIIDQDNLNVQLHGSCLILSKLFFEKQEGLYGDTFLYYEEEILRYLAKRDNLLLMYTPQIRLIHKEGLATKCDLGTYRKKEIFFNKHSFQSCRIFLRLMLSDRKSEHHNRSQRVHHSDA